MKKIYLLSLTAILLLGFACQPKQNDVEEPTLTLSTSELSFDNAGAEKSVTITTNQNKWSASSPKEGEWIELSQNGNELKVKLTANELGKMRQSIVLVNAGGVQEKLKIVQSAADVVLEAMPESITLPPAGGTATVDISSNTEVWTASLDQEVDWLSIYARPASGVIQLKALPNASSEARQVKLIATSGTKVIEVTVTQAGKQKYIFPIFPKSASSFDSVLRQEVSRGSILKVYGDPANFFDTHFPGTAEFLTASDVIPKIFYTFDIITTDEGKLMIFKSVEMDSYDYAEMTSEAFTAFVAEQGFVLKKKEGNVALFEDDERLLSLTMTLKENLGATLTFTPIVKQDKSYPTFPAFPYEPIRSFLNVYTKKVEDLKAHEESLGSTLAQELKAEKFPEETALLLYNTVKNNHWLNRIYFIITSETEGATDETKGSVQEALGVFDNPNLALFKALGEWHVTDEFKALLKKEGLVFFRKHKGGYIYHRESDEFTIFFRVEKFSDLPSENQDVLAINYFHISLESTSSKIFSNRDANITELVKKDNIALAKKLSKMSKYFK